MKDNKELIDLRRILSKNLLLDYTTEKNIVWATDMYLEYGNAYKKDSQMFIDDIIKLLEISALVPRNMKTQEQQQERSRNKGEVFTPSWIINKMNNCCDEKWFKQKNVFNIENDDNTWTSNDSKIQFDSSTDWKKYIYSKRIEITCGEAPYIVSRYDVTTGNPIAIKNRVGILDRKLRVVCENTNTKKSWLQWTYKAFQSVYGYEYQGDSLLFARINLVQTFIDYYFEMFSEYPEKRMVNRIIEIVSWNFWQMDGLQGLSPSGVPREKFEQLSFDDIFNETNNENNKTSYCKIRDWENNTIFEYRALKKEDD